MPSTARRSPSTVPSGDQLLAWDSRAHRAAPLPSSRARCHMQTQKPIFEQNPNGSDGSGSSFSSLETALRQSFDIVASACATTSHHCDRTAQTNPRTICSFLRRRASFCMACCAGCWCSRSITSVNSSIRLFVGLCEPGLTMFEVQTSGDVCAVFDEVTICARALRIPSLQPAAPTEERKYCTWLLTPS